MTWIGWNNSEKHSSGAGYGFKIDRAERDRNFNPEWQQITVELPYAARHKRCKRECRQVVFLEELPRADQ